MGSNRALFSRVALLLTLLFVCQVTQAQMKIALPWYYSLPATDEGKQKMGQIDLYKSKGDIQNVKLVSNYARSVEPGCFLFAETYVEAAYNTREGDKVVGLSDSLSWSELATPQTFLYNAWIHDWAGDKAVAIRAIDRGLVLYPEDMGLLRGGMQLSIESGDISKINKYGLELLTRYPRDWQTYYDYQKFYAEKTIDDYAIIMGELALAVGGNSSKNIEIKNTLINSYNSWIKSRKGSKMFSSLYKIPEGLSEIRNMQNLLFLQGYTTYQYGKNPNTNYLEERLYNYKFQIMQECNWIAYYYEKFGVSLFPTDYEKFLKSNAQEMAALNLCLSRIEALD